MNVRVKIFFVGLSIVYSSVWCASAFAQTQRSDKEITRDTITRWIYHNTALKKKVFKPITTQDGKIYSVWQQTLVDSLQRWIQASWNPRAGACYIRNSMVPGSQYEIIQNTPAHAYGISYHLFPAEYRKQLKKLDVGGEAHQVLSIYANGPVGDYIKMLSGKGRNWFIATSALDVATTTGDGFRDDLKNYPSVAPYLHWHRQNRDHTIILAKDNKLPFEKVTVGEYLKTFEEFTRSRATTSDPNYKLPSDFVEQELKRGKLVADRFKDRLSEPVRFGSDDGYLESENICNGKNCGEETFEIYQLSPATMEAMKQDKPLWVNITLRWSPGDLRDYHMYQSFSNNFNFDFVYNSFFAPEKVKGMIYKPVTAPLKNIPPKSYASGRSALVTAAKTNPDIMFFDDFSGNAIGKEPVGWFSTEVNTSSLSTKFSTIQSAENGKDVRLMLSPRHALVSDAIHNPLPQKFTVSFAISCSENYASSAVSFFLSDIKDNDKMLLANFGSENLGSRSNATLLVRIRPANNNNEGLTFSFNGPKGDTRYANASSNGRKISSFSGARGSQTANVELKVNGTDLTITVNKELVLDEKNIFPAGVVFSTMSWSALSSVMEDNDAVYLSNVKIERN